MHVIAVVGQKGGTGKTTLVQCLAVAFAKDGHSVMVLDLDPQANAANWYDRREDKESPMVTTVPLGRLAQAVDAARESGVQIVFIDTPGKLEGAALGAVKLASLVLVPLRPQIKDLETLPATLSLMQNASAAPAFAVLSAVPVTGKRHEEAAEFIRSHSLAVCPAWLSQRAAFGDADMSGLAAQEFDPTGKAAGEVESVYKFTNKLLKEIENGSETNAA